MDKDIAPKSATLDVVRPVSSSIQRKAMRLSEVVMDSYYFLNARGQYFVGSPFVQFRLRLIPFIEFSDEPEIQIADLRVHGVA